MLFPWSKVLSLAQDHKLPIKAEKGGASMLSANKGAEQALAPGM